MRVSGAIVGAGALLAVLLMSGAVRSSWMQTYWFGTLNSPNFSGLMWSVFCFAAISMVCAAISSAWRAGWALAIALLAIYAGIVLSPKVVATATLAIFSIWAIGEAVRRLVAPNNEHAHVSIAFGMFSHLAIAILLSLVGVAGTGWHLSVIIFVSLLSLAWARPHSLPLVQRSMALWFLASFLFLWLVTSMRALGICTDCAVGLYRPDIYILGWGSIFNPLSLTYGTHYYPKGFEIIAAPFVFTKHGTELRLINLALCAILISSAIRFTSRSLSGGKNLSVFWAAGITTTVVVFGAFQAKADTLEALCMLIGVLHLAAAARERSMTELVLSCLLMVLALTVRNHMYVAVLSVFPAMIVVAAYVVAACDLRSTIKGIGAVSIGVAIFGTVVFARDYVITGLFFATPPIGPSDATAYRLVFENLTNIQTQQFASIWSVPDILWSIFFAPATLDLHKDRWVGLLVPWSAIAFVVYCLTGPRRSWDGALFVLGWATFACWAVISYGLAYSINRRGGDGNYFIYPLLVGCTFVVVLISRRPSLSRMWSIGAIGIIAVNITALPNTAYVSFWLIKGAFTARQQLDAMWDKRVHERLDENGLGALYDDLRSHNGKPCRLTVFEPPAAGGIISALRRTDCVVGTSKASSPYRELVLNDAAHTLYLVPSKQVSLDRLVQNSLRGRMFDRFHVGGFTAYKIIDGRAGKPPS